MSWSPFLIAPEELPPHLGKPGLSIVDASWYLPAQKRFARVEFEEAHVPGAVFFDQDEVVDPASSLPHAFPPPDVFAKAASALGISNTDTIVVYDGMGLFSAPRVWWMFRAFGAKDVRVLDGGFPAWIEAGLPVETGPAAPKPATFHAELHPEAVATMADMRRFIESGACQIADARPADRFAGSAPEPREGVRPGHMPGAVSVPFSAVSINGRLKSPEALRAVFEEAGIDPERPVVTTCGSGVTAAVLNLALSSLQNREVTLYDGSWTEWGSTPGNSVETGAAR